MFKIDDAISYVYVKTDAVFTRDELTTFIDALIDGYDVVVELIKMNLKKDTNHEMH